ncbi:MAG: hypothetical protein M0P59_10100 [Gallionella sp.]|jgi:hypothetical protein|nr:hypothetical protein [Gallionella sp.]MCK9354498.1 hypothetical protein [Gallionella sp.]
MNAQVDGNTTLTSQQSTINYAEKANNSQLVSYTKGTAPINIAMFQDMPLGQDITPLILTEVPADTSIDTLVEAQLKAGKHLVFQNEIFVNGAETIVAGFR